MITQVDKSFVFDLTVLLAEAFANLTQFTEFNYTNCYTAEAPELEAVEQTIQYTKAVREVSHVHDRSHSHI